MLVGYEEFDARLLGNTQVVSWLSCRDEDICWDTFLRATKCGQFQQSTMWARAKITEGWAPLRVVISLHDEIIGGFQILRRSSWWGGIGYVSKGPVVIPGRIGLAEYAIDLLLKVSRKARLRAVIVQPPDLCREMTSSLMAQGFLPNVLNKVNDATWLVNLRDGFESVASRMSRNTRQYVKQAQRSGITIREGGRADLPEFLSLMRTTCLRQGAKPSPNDVKFLLGLWDAAQPVEGIKLFIAEHEQRPVSGLVCIPFGRTVSAWKKGWNFTDRSFHPNELLMYESLKWACREGYEDLDFTAFDKHMALAILEGAPVSTQGQQSRHFFNTRFGGRPQLLPPAMIYCPNPIGRLAYRALFRSKIRQADEDRRVDAAAQICPSPVA